MRTVRRIHGPDDCHPLADEADRERILDPGARTLKDRGGIVQVALEIAD
jgi:hypothetical protein